METDAAEISSARDYYRTILPFYEKESVARAHLAFWRHVARSHAHRRILEIGAGLGRITAELARVGEAVGLDVSLEMLSAASRRAGHARFVAAETRRACFVAADARRAAFGPVFDLIVAPGDPISHMTTLADRRRTLRAVARQLAPGGFFVLEGLYRRRNEIAMPRRRIRHSQGVLRIEEAWFPIGQEDLWHARYRYEDRGDDGAVRSRMAAFLARAWDPATIRAFFAEAGLEIVSLWGDFDRRPFRRDSSRLLVTARRVRRAGLPVRTSGTRPEPLI
ncbi:MAG TPA: class I SAM-dependent methyltransferase [Thermoanaerobaculia bacterium]